MKNGRKTRLAASFVVTAASLPVAASLEGCRKQTVEEPEQTPGKQPAYLHRQGDRCTMSVPMSCPKGVMCNPPPPTEIDCPPALLDAGEPAPPGASTARPPDKQDWLRVRPHLFASRYGCSYTPEQFCAPPPKPHQCTAFPQAVTLTCTPGSGADAAVPTSWSIAAFTYKDGLGVCHKVPAFECAGPDCAGSMPAGEPAPCP